MSTKKQGGKLTQRKRPNPKFLGVKVSDGEKVFPGNILVRQRGTKFRAGKNVSVGRDHSLYSRVVGVAKFWDKLGRKVVSVAK